jgi:hypothetical protein
VAEDIPGVADLYRLDPGEFVAARDALAKQLRGEGRRDAAAAVGKLRRPPTTAWALNRAAREHPELLDAALQAGHELREATEAALAGDAGGLRAATAAERAASDRLLTAAASYLGEVGGAAQQRMAATLRAAVIDDAVADELRRGVLATDHDPPAFGFAGDVEIGPPPVRPSRQPARRSGVDRPASAPAKPDREAQRAAERDAVQQRRRVAEQRREVARLERSAARLARAADAAEAAAFEARAAADAAQRALDEARQRGPEG